jgi:uncharacterized protein (TIGR03083 family)
VTTVDRDEVVAALDEEWEALAALAGELDPDEWSRPTDCPGWTVKGQFSHVLGVEAMLLGRPAPDVALPDSLPHVRNDLGRVNELWVARYSDQPVTELLADLGEVIVARRAALATMTQEDFDADAMTPAGADTYGRFMQIRVMDQWFHEQDIRRATGRPGHLDGWAPSFALAEVKLALGYAVGKKAGAPKGSTIRFELTGEIAERLDVAVRDRAELVEGLTGTPTATIELPGDAFLRITGGRVPKGEAARLATRIDGDRTLGEQVLDGLAFTV